MIVIQRMDIVSLQMNANVSWDIQERLVVIVNHFRAASMEFVKNHLNVDVCQDGLEFFAKLVSDTFNILRI